MNDYKEIILKREFADIFKDYKLVCVRCFGKRLCTVSIPVIDTIFEPEEVSEITFKFIGSPDIDKFIRILSDALIKFRWITSTSDEIETIACLLEQIRELNNEIARLKNG